MEIFFFIFFFGYVFPVTAVTGHVSVTGNFFSQRLRIRNRLRIRTAVTGRFSVTVTDP